MSFKYPHTCPKIDKEIERAKDSIISSLEDYCLELCPFLTVEKLRELSKKWGSDLYDQISGAFESTRESNEDMRKEAEHQIENLKLRIEELEKEIDDLENQSK